MSHPCGTVGSFTERQKAGPGLLLDFRKGRGKAPSVFLVALLLMMLISSPVFHTHYVSMAILPVPVLLSMILIFLLYSARGFFYATGNNGGHAV